MSRSISLSKTQQYLEWLKTKLFLDSNAESAKRRVVKRGEVYKCYLGIGIGSEESKERPCVVLQRDRANLESPNTIVAPITHTSSTLPVVIPISPKHNSSGDVVLDGNVLLGNIVCVSKARLGDYVARLEPSEMKAVDEAIAISLDIKRYYDKLDNILNDKLVYIDKLKKRVKDLEELLAQEKKSD
ncbi:MAG: type II toxin-antitoxin system PemK/MazF family toxin [Tepidanaerobacter acetatoxydans]|uniref:type II toxin-antitoxin system PemK/MazF family toxin n=1 Tax=Tepidanaerobacter acetatoxydans TaxID=499229 RepID=UPI0026F307C9|nr:type II toxin-antitoxin system PemK/MazF family toxin [Tepidanaerobacter acetatoxydans]NLU09637.1 type II toxin-antitoxin system PemK/MazF family toxin [Tepidanaerobacter acetatoxydans]